MVSFAIHSFPYFTPTATPKQLSQKACIYLPYPNSFLSFLCLNNTIRVVLSEHVVNTTKSQGFHWKKNVKVQSPELFKKLRERSWKKEEEL